MFSLRYVAFTYQLGYRAVTSLPSPSTSESTHLQDICLVSSTGSALRVRAIINPFQLEASTMTDALAIISFVCAGFFLLFLFADRVRLNTPTSTLITWFFICNLIHGVNAVIWKGNVEIKIPIWCDISTCLTFAKWKVEFTKSYSDKAAFGS